MAGSMLDMAATPPRPTRAFATLVTADAALPGALVLATSVRTHHPHPPPPTGRHYHLVALCTPATLARRSLTALRLAFDVVVGVEPITLESLLADRWLGGLARGDRRLEDLGLENLGLEGFGLEETGLAPRCRTDLLLTKLHLWRLTAYERIVYLEADMLVRADLTPLLYPVSVPLDTSFHPGASATTPPPDQTHSARPTAGPSLPPPLLAAPDNGWPDTFNTGLLSLQPSRRVYDWVRAFFADFGSWDSGDQGVLNDFFGAPLRAASDFGAVAPHEAQEVPLVWENVEHHHPVGTSTSFLNRPCHRIPGVTPRSYSLSPPPLITPPHTAPSAPAPSWLVHTQNTQPSSFALSSSDDNEQYGFFSPSTPRSSPKAYLRDHVAHKKTQSPGISTPRASHSPSQSVSRSYTYTRAHNSTLLRSIVGQQSEREAYPDRPLGGRQFWGSWNPGSCCPVEALALWRGPGWMPVSFTYNVTVQGNYTWVFFLSYHSLLALSMP